MKSILGIALSIGLLSLLGCATAAASQQSTDSGAPSTPAKGLTKSIVTIYDMAEVLPLPGRFLSIHAQSTMTGGKSVKELKGVVLEEGDPGWRVAYPGEQPVPLQNSDIVVIPVKGKPGAASSFFVAVSNTNLPVEIAIGKDGRNLSFDMRYHFADALRAGRVLRFAAGDAQLKCFCSGQLNEPAFQVRYTFGENAWARWDATRSAIVWSGITAVAEATPPGN